MLFFADGLAHAGMDFWGPVIAIILFTLGVFLGALFLVMRMTVRGVREMTQRESDGRKSSFDARERRIIGGLKAAFGAALLLQVGALFASIHYPDGGLWFMATVALGFAVAVALRLVAVVRRAVKP